MVGSWCVGYVVWVGGIGLGWSGYVYWLDSGVGCGLLGCDLVFYGIGV